MSSKSTLPRAIKGEVRKYNFINLTKEEVVKYLDKIAPISLKKNIELVDRVSERYPHISKDQVAIIIKYVFSTIRELLILGKILYVANFLQITRIYFARKTSKGKITGKMSEHFISPLVRILTITPKSLR